MIRKWTERLWLDCIQQIVPMWQCNFNWKRAHEHITKSLAVRAVLKRVSHDLSNTLTKFSNLSFLVLQDNTFIIYLSRIFLSTLHENFTCPPWWDEITRNDWTWPFRYQNKCHLRHRLRWKAAAYESYRRDNFTICIGVFIWCDSKRMWSDSLGDNHDEHKYRIDLVVCGSFIVRILVLPEELTENIWLPHGNLWIIATKRLS